MRFASFVASAVVLCLSQWSVAIESQNAVAKVLRDWEARQNRIDRIRYVAEGTALLPDQNRSAEYRFEYKLDFANGRCVKDRFKQQLYPPMPDAVYVPHSIFYYDGNTMVELMPKPPRPDGFEYAPDIKIMKSPLRFEPGDYAVLFAHGLYPGTHLSNLRPGVDDAPAMRTAGTGIINGRSHVILRTVPVMVSSKHSAYYEFWVDPSRDSAISRWLRVVDGSSTMSVDVDYDRTPLGWLTSQWRYVNYRPDGTAERIESIRVTQCDLHPTFEISDFQSPPVKGMIVQHSVGETTTYVSGGSDGQDVPLAVHMANQSTATARRQWLAVGLLAACVAVIAIAALWRRSHRIS